MTKGGYGLLLQGNPLFRDAEQALEVSHIVLTVAHVYVLHNTGFHLGGGICPPPPFEFALESQRGLQVQQCTFPSQKFLTSQITAILQFLPCVRMCSRVIRLVALVCVCVPRKGFQKNCIMVSHAMSICNKCIMHTTMQC